MVKLQHRTGLGTEDTADPMHSNTIIRTTYCRKKKNIHLLGHYLDPGNLLSNILFYLFLSNETIISCKQVWVT